MPSNRDPMETVVTVIAVLGSVSLAMIVATVYVAHVQF